MKVVPRTVASMILVGMMAVGTSTVAAQAPDATKSLSTSDTLVQLTRQVIRSAAKIGLEEAGTRLLGSGWKYVRAVVEPAYSELARQYPALNLLGTPAAEAAAANAVAAFDASPAMQASLFARFDRLDRDHGQILLEIGQIKNQLNANQELTVEVLEVLRRLGSAGSTAPPPSLAALSTRTIENRDAAASATVDRVRQRVREIVARQLGHNIREVVDSARYSDLGAEELDSIELLLTFEEAFEIEIPDDDAEGLTTIGSTITYIARRLERR